MQESSNKTKRTCQPHIFSFIFLLNWYANIQLHQPVAVFKVLKIPLRSQWKSQCQSFCSLNAQNLFDCKYHVCINHMRDKPEFTQNAPKFISSWPWQLVKEELKSKCGIQRRLPLVGWLNWLNSFEKWYPSCGWYIHDIWVQHQRSAGGEWVPMRWGKRETILSTTPLPPEWLLHWDRQWSFINCEEQWCFINCEEQSHKTVHRQLLKWEENQNKNVPSAY